MIRVPFRRRTTPARRGIVAVEFALVAPLLGTLFIGMTELSRGMMVLKMLSDSARMGCRTGIQRDKGNSDIISDAQNILGDNGISATNVTVTITVTDPSGVTLSDSLGAASGSVVSVQVSVPVSAVMWTSGYFLKSSWLQSQTVVMMKQ
jgi:Flp pilus assembly protein TadG